MDRALRAAVGWLTVALALGGCGAIRWSGAPADADTGYSPYSSERVRTALCDPY